MREILFRGKTYSDKWVYGYLLKGSIDNDFYILENAGATPFWIDPETVGQFTGLTDKNGTKIFEGDIVAYNTLFVDGKEYQEIGYFECDEHYVSFRIHGTQMTPFHCEVIGNIHDNPELLEKSNENQTK